MNQNCLALRLHGLMDQKYSIISGNRKQKILLKLILFSTIIYVNYSNL